MLERESIPYKCLETHAQQCAPSSSRPDSEWETSARIRAPKLGRWWSPQCRGSRTRGVHPELIDEVNLAIILLDYKLPLEKKCFWKSPHQIWLEIRLKERYFITANIIDYDLVPLRERKTVRSAHLENEEWQIEAGMLLLLGVDEERIEGDRENAVDEIGDEALDEEGDHRRESAHHTENADDERAALHMTTAATAAVLAVLRIERVHIYRLESLMRVAKSSNV